MRGKACKRTAGCLDPCGVRALNMLTSSDCFAIHSNTSLLAWYGQLILADADGWTACRRCSQAEVLEAIRVFKEAGASPLLFAGRWLAGFLLILLRLTYCACLPPTCLLPTCLSVTCLSAMCVSATYLPISDCNCVQRTPSPAIVHRTLCQNAYFSTTPNSASAPKRRVQPVHHP